MHSSSSDEGVAEGRAPTGDSENHGNSDDKPFFALANGARVGFSGAYVKPPFSRSRNQGLASTGFVCDFFSWRGVVYSQYLMV